LREMPTYVSFAAAECLNNRCRSDRINSVCMDGPLLCESLETRVRGLWKIVERISDLSMVVAIYYGILVIGLLRWAPTTA
jgi:hypothetical protein